MIIDFEVLRTLPGTGSLPVHYYVSEPTPWQEGYAVRFYQQSGPSWVANFQAGDTHFSDTFLWPEANAVVVIAYGICYLVSLYQSSNYQVLQNGVTGYVLCDDHEHLVLVAANNITAYDKYWQKAWTRDVPAQKLEIGEYEKGFISGRALIKPPDGWARFQLSQKDGTPVKKE